MVRFRIHGTGCISKKYTFQGCKRHPKAQAQAQPWAQALIEAHKGLSIPDYSELASYLLPAFYLIINANIIPVHAQFPRI